jgi:hypothetical protein
MIMKTEHIKSVAMITDESTLWKHMEFPEGDHWHVVFEVSKGFKRAFFEHMRSNADNIFRSGIIADDTLTEEDIAELDVFHYDGSSWFLSDTGQHIVRSTGYDDLMEKEVPADWWMGNIALMKEVLGKTV